MIEKLRRLEKQCSKSVTANTPKVTCIECDQHLQETAATQAYLRIAMDELKTMTEVTSEEKNDDTAMQMAHALTTHLSRLRGTLQSMPKPVVEEERQQLPLNSKDGHVDVKRCNNDASIDGYDSTSATVPLSNVTNHQPSSLLTPMTGAAVTTTVPTASTASTSLTTAPHPCQMTNEQMTIQSMQSNAVMPMSLVAPRENEKENAPHPATATAATDTAATGAAQRTRVVKKYRAGPAMDITEEANATGQCNQQ
ncbi:hypothetical protein BDF19DRAFT_436353 [Syncephalis fuscata]|nr:hypothetical protein BDF19DRAFT_436353 [Syncephalis fuscata]